MFKRQILFKGEALAMMKKMSALAVVVVVVVDREGDASRRVVLVVSPTCFSRGPCLALKLQEILYD